MNHLKHEHMGRGDHGGGRHGMGRGGHGGGRRRMFDAGELRLVLLRLIEGRARHGYDLIREIETRTGGAYAPSPGIVYPTLTLLEELEHIQATTSEGAKKAFSLTPAGEAYLAERRAEADAALGRLDALRAESGRIESGPVWRAMQNLKAAMAQRLAGEPEKRILFDTADILDEAARKIERLS